MRFRCVLKAFCGRFRRRFAGFLKAFCGSFEGVLRAIGRYCAVVLKAFFEGNFEGVLKVRVEIIHFRASPREFFPKAIASGFPTVSPAHDARGCDESNHWVSRPGPGKITRNI